MRCIVTLTKYDVALQGVSETLRKIIGDRLKLFIETSFYTLVNIKNVSDTFILQTV